MNDTKNDSEISDLEAQLPLGAKPRLPNAPDEPDGGNAAPKTL
jgi:hypothetical protein